MKHRKLFFVALFVVLGAAALSAQGWGYGHGMMPGYGFGMPSPPMAGRSLQQRVVEKQTLKGYLTVSNGRISLSAGGKLYQVSGIRQLVGFVDGLKENATVEIEGGVETFKINNNGAVEERYMLHAEKLTIGGKVYDNLRGNPSTDGGALPGMQMHMRRWG